MNLTVETWPLDKIIPYDKNAKLHHVEWIAQSISEFSIDQPIVVDGQGVIIKGHGRLKAAKQLGLTEFPVVVRTDLTPEQIRLARIADNRSAEGGWDSALLGDELNALLNAMPDYDFDALGLSEDWFSSLDVTLDTAPAYDDAALDNVPELNEEEEPITKPGDLWQLGKHRLLCGDSTSETDVARLMNGEQVTGVFTSPPYAEQRKEQYGGINSKDYSDWFCSIQKIIRGLLNNNGNFFLNIKPHAEKKQRSLYVFDLVCKMVRDWNWLFVDEYCWLRTGIPQQVVNRFKNAFEPVYWFSLSDDFCFYPDNVKHYSDSVPLALGKGAGDTNAAKRQGSGKGAIYGNKIVEGMAYPSNVLNFKQNAEALGHPAAFPVQLPSFFLKAYSLENDLWFEPFGGSGTTLIACESLGRQARLMEISPRYCDLIVKRWETLTGNHAVLL